MNEGGGLFGLSLLDRYMLAQRPIDSWAARSTELNKASPQNHAAARVLGRDVRPASRPIATQHSSMTEHQLASPWSAE